MKTIYFVYLETANSKHDRSSRFNTGEEPCFFDWIEEQRKIIEKEKLASAVIVNCNILYSQQNHTTNKETLK